MYIFIYSGPCILRPPLRPQNFDLKLEVVLKWRDIYIENMRMVASLKMEGIVKWRVLNRRDHCNYTCQTHSDERAEVLFKKQF